MVARILNYYLIFSITTPFPYNLVINNGLKFELDSGSFMLYQIK